MAKDNPAGASASRFFGMSPAPAAFSGALIGGLAAHGAALFNKLSWHDDIFSLFGTGDTITSGRWMLHVLSLAEVQLFGDGHFSLPLMNGLFSLLCIGASAALLVVLLKIRSRTLSALLGLLMAVFPVVTSLFGFMFTVPYYMLALAMMSAGGALICAGDSWWKKAAGVLLGGCSVGVYQAFLPVLPAMILLYDLSRIAGEDREVQYYLKKALLQTLCLVGVLAVYLAGNRLFLSLYDLELGSYMGLDQAGSTSLSDYLARAVRACAEFFRPARNVLWDMYPQHMHYMYLLMLGMDGALGFLLIFRLGRRRPLRAVLAALLLALFPLSCNLIFVMSEEVHSLMVYGQAMHFALLVWLADSADFRFPRRKRLLSGFAALVFSVSGVMYARYANQCYLKTTFQQQQAISWNTALVARIKSVPGYRDELPVAWVNRDNLADMSLKNIDELNITMLASYDQDLTEYVNNWAWERFLRRWCGFGPATVDPEDVKDLPQVQAMPSYPDDGSIRVIDGIVVVKF